MRKHRIRAASLLTAAALLASMLTLSASAADSKAPVVWSDKIGSGTAKLVTIPMGDGRTGEISLANNSIVEAVSAKTLIEQKNNQADTHVVAAINGGFFNSYTKGTPSFPNSCPLIMDAVVVEGKLIHTGRTSILGFSSDGTPMVDWVTLKGQVKLGNGFNPAPWSVNKLETDPTAVMLFDEHLTLPVTIPSSSTMFRIRDGRIVSVEAGGVLRVAKGESVMVYNSALAATETGYSRIPQAGMSAEVTFTASGTSRDGAWAEVETALTGGPVLVKDGKNVVNDQRNSLFYNDPKQKPNLVGARSFVGVTQSGGLVFGTVNASFNQIANWMVKNNIKEGVAMDGGASSMLYADGSGYVTSAGRNLAIVLTIVDRGGASNPGSNENPGSTSNPGSNENQNPGSTSNPGNNENPGGDAPDAWAVDEVSAAIYLGLVPETLQNRYKENISRQDFCLLIWELLKQDPDIESKISARPEVTFPDVNSPAVEMVARAGIVSGSGGRFNPTGTLTRAEAAKILALTVQFLGGQDAGGQYPFTDRSSFPTWDKGWIDYCGVNKIMTGTSGAFNPGGHFPRQQAMVTMLRIYNNYLIG